MKIMSPHSSLWSMSTVQEVKYLDLDDVFRAVKNSEQLVPWTARKKQSHRADSYPRNIQALVSAFVVNYRIMRNQVICISSLALAAVIRPTQCFLQMTPSNVVYSTISRTNQYVLFANDRDDFVPETSFGAEVVPEGQRPVNEYLEMRRSPLFEWASNEVGTKGLLTRLGVVYAVVFALVGFPIAGATFTQDGFLLQKIASSNVGTLGLVLVLLIRLYSGWGYAGARLQSKVIEYEETGWYDGSFEPKTEAEYKRDMFLYKQDVKPVTERLKMLTLTCAALWVASCVGLKASYSLKPVFNEYDPRVLERVQRDEDFAAAAARASGGRPTYCDNRYYRAVANGGQGCN